MAHAQVNDHVENIFFDPAVGQKFDVTKRGIKIHIVSMDLN